MNFTGVGGPKCAISSVRILPSERHYFDGQSVLKYVVSILRNFPCRSVSVIFFKFFRVLLNKILHNSHTSRICLCACRRLELIKKSFLLLSSLRLPLVLGYPWLQRHNPHSDWSTGVIHELGGLLSAVIFNICSPCLQLCCVTEVSLEYHDLREVFSKANSHLCLLVIHMTVPSTACQVQPHKGTPVFIVGSRKEGHGDLHQ